MTEAEAYDVLGWPHVGTRGWFVLPLSGSGSDNWTAYACTECTYRGVSLRHVYDPICVGCGAPNRRFD